MLPQNADKRQPPRTNSTQIPPGCHRVSAHVRRGGRDSRLIPVVAYVRCRSVVQFSRFTETALPPAAMRPRVPLDADDRSRGAA